MEKWVKLRLGYWRRLHVASGERTLAAISSLRRKHLRWEYKGASEGWMGTTRDLLVKHGLYSHWLDPKLCTLQEKGDWKLRGFDLLLLGALVVGGGQWGSDLFPYLLLLNPADVFRIVNIFGVEDVRTMYGLSTVFPENLARPGLLGGVMVLWIVMPLALAVWRFRK